MQMKYNFHHFHIIRPFDVYILEPCLVEDYLQLVGEPTLKKCFIKGDNLKVAGSTQTMLRFHP